MWGIVERSAQERYRNGQKGTGTAVHRYWQRVCQREKQGDIETTVVEVPPDFDFITPAASGV
jgi:hypothetical protein